MGYKIQTIVRNPNGGVDWLYYSNRPEVKRKRPSETKKAPRRLRPVELPPVPAAYRKERREAFLGLLKRAAKSAHRRGMFPNHSRALDGIAAWIGVEDYRRALERLDELRPERYPWVELKDLIDDIEETCFAN